MDEVGLHRFLGRCDSNNLDSIFPSWDQMIKLKCLMCKKVKKTSSGLILKLSYYFPLFWSTKPKKPTRGYTGTAVKRNTQKQKICSWRSYPELQTYPMKNFPIILLNSVEFPIACLDQVQVTLSAEPCSRTRAREKEGQPCYPTDGLYLVYIETILLYLVCAKSESHFITHSSNSNRILVEWFEKSNSCKINSLLRLELVGEVVGGDKYLNSMSCVKMWLVVTL